jgi:hypothetical protein
MTDADFKAAIGRKGWGLLKGKVLVITGEKVAWLGVEEDRCFALSMPVRPMTSNAVCGVGTLSGVTSIFTEDIPTKEVGADHYKENRDSEQAR